MDKDLDLDPFRFGYQVRPAPIDGELPPAVCVVDEDGPFPSSRPPWVRFTAVVFCATFVVLTALTGAAIGVAWSPRSDTLDPTAPGQATAGWPTTPDAH